MSATRTTGGAHVADQVIRARQSGVGQQRQHGFQPAPGHPHQKQFVMRGDGAVELAPGTRAAGEEGAIQIGGQQQGRLPGDGGRKRNIRHGGASFEDEPPTCIACRHGTAQRGRGAENSSTWQ